MGSLKPKADFFIKNSGAQVGGGYQMIDFLEAHQAIHEGDGLSIVRASPSLVIKYGISVRKNEAIAMHLLGQHTTIPIPRVFQACTFGPLTKPGIEIPMFDTYIWMEYLQGEHLDQVWHSLDEDQKCSVMADLKEYIGQLRAFGSPGYIGCLDGQRARVEDPILSHNLNKGPFTTEDEFNSALIKAALASGAYQEGDVPFLHGMLASHKHGINLTHGNIRPENILIKDGRITGIIGWKLAGWYPEYWEFAKALVPWRGQTDWERRLRDILTPYYCEQGVYNILKKAIR